MNRTHLRDLKSTGAFAWFMALTSVFIALTAPARADFCPNPSYGGCTVGCNIIEVSRDCTSMSCGVLQYCEQIDFVIVEMGQEYCFTPCGWLTDYPCNC
jgi:hypothetical protein